MTTTHETKQALEALFDSSKTSKEYAGGFVSRYIEVLQSLDVKKVSEIVQAVYQAQQDNKTIFFVANGGSAAVASHIVNDLCANSLVGSGRGFRAFCLADNVESVTAIANDSCFENIFSHQLQCNMNPGDLVIALSVSGNSENIIRAVDFANENGAMTIGMCGFEGGRLLERCKLALHIPSTRDEYGPVEDIFSNVGHILTGYLTMQRGKKLYH